MCNCGKKKVVVPNVQGPPNPLLTVSEHIVKPIQRRFNPSISTTPAVVPVESFPDNADTSLWGPALWSVLHISAHFTGSSKHISPWKAVIAALRSGIPCENCRNHFISWHNSNPLRFSFLFRNIHLHIVSWVLRLHNHANSNTGSGGSWNIAQSTNLWSLGGRSTRLSEASVSLESIRNIISDPLFTALQTLLQILSN